MGNSSMPMSKSLMEPSPAAARTWFSCDSDQARSKRESCVSNLGAFVSFEADEER